jgi:hypothetical protein
MRALAAVEMAIAAEPTVKMSVVQILTAAIAGVPSPDTKKRSRKPLMVWSNIVATLGNAMRRTPIPSGPSKIIRVRFS